MGFGLSHLGSKDTVDRWYFAAAGKWPSVKWSKYLYKSHLCIVRRETTRYPEEIFLAGAAGFGINDAWSVVYEEYSSDVIRCLRNMRVPGHEPYDLWTQALEKLLREVPHFPVDQFTGYEECALPPSKIVEFEGRSRLRNYILLIAQNIGRDHLRRKEVKLESADVACVSGDQGKSQISGLDDVELKQVQSLLRDGMSCLTKNEKCLLKSVGLLGMSNIEVSVMQGYSASTATRYRQAAVESMKRKLESGLGAHESVSDRVLEAAVKYFRRTLQCLEDDSSA